MTSEWRSKISRIFACRRLAGFQSNGGRHRRANPQIAFLERRQEFAAELRQQRRRRPARKPTRRSDHGFAVIERPMQDRHINPAQRADNDRFRLLDLFGQKERRQHRRNGEGREQSAEQRQTVGSRHRTENLAFDTLHGEQRNERRHSYGRREKDRLVDLQCACKDQTQSVVPVHRFASLRGFRVGSSPKRPSARCCNRLCRSAGC